MPRKSSTVVQEQPAKSRVTRRPVRSQQSEEAHGMTMDEVISNVSPHGFAASSLHHDHWEKPNAILDSIAVNRKTAVKSCHASGKTFLSADAVLWWISRWDSAIAISTAPTWKQVQHLLWGEIRSSVRKGIYGIPSSGLTSTQLKLSDKNYALGISTNEGVNFQGFHSDHILFVLDEAPGVDPAIWDAIEGAAAGGHVAILAIGNPIVPSGTFYDAFNAKRHLWNRFTISAFDTPNLQGVSYTFTDPILQREVTLGSGKDIMSLSEQELNENVRPYLVTRGWVKERIIDWGPGHPLFDSKVLGEFPAESEFSLISLRWIDMAKYAIVPTSEKIRFGLDVAGPGEAETVLIGMRGQRMESLKAWPHADPRGEIVAILRPFFERGELEQVNIDSAGIGWGMYLHLRDIFGGSIIKAVNVGEGAYDSEHFVNLKAELYWGLRMRFKDGAIAGEFDDVLQGQLASILYEHNARGQVKIETKDDAKKRGVPSPDRAEALMLATAKNSMPLGLLGHGQAENKAAETEELDRLVKASITAVPVVGVQVVEQKTATAPGSSVCPKCASDCISRIPGGFRCSQCGEQFGQAVVAPSAGGGRGGMLNGI